MTPSNTYKYTYGVAKGSGTALGLLLCLSAQLAMAQAVKPTEDVVRGADDIIVTAQRREQTALKVPLSLTALDENLIENKQVSSLADLQFVAPGIRSGQQNGSNRLFIRGIGLSSFAAGADSSVAFYVDGVYIGRPTQQLSSFYDISRVEVLRGPQGALYGRNATGGAVNLISNDPERELGGYVALSAGNYGLHQAEGAISAPLSTNGDLRVRAAFKLLDRNGYGRDIANETDINDASAQSGRLTLQYNPNRDIDIRLIGEYTHENDNNYHTANFGPYQFSNLALCPVTNGIECQLPGVTASGGIEVRNSQDGATNLDLLGGARNRREGFALTLNARFALNDVLNVNSITGWRKFDRYNASNADGSSSGIGNVDYNENNRQFSQELVLNYDGGALQATAGVSYYHEKLDNLVVAPFIQFDNPATPQFDNPYKENGTLKIDAFAAYLQATYAITPELRITAAGRYSSEKRTSTGLFTGLFVPPVPLNDAQRWSSFTPKFGLEYDLGPTTLVYASYTKGFKSGTFNVGQNNPAINPEKIESYEAGIKSRLFDNRIDVTAAYFHYKYSDLQVNKIIGIGTVTTNAAAAKTDGFEIAVNARVTPQFTVSGNFTYLDSTFTDFLSVNPLFQASPAEDLKGNMLSGSPKYALVVGGQYALPVGSNGQELVFNVDASYQSKIFFSEFNDIQIGQKSATKVNASMKFDTGKSWSVSVWGKNIFDVQTAGSKILGIGLWGLPIYGAIDAPATFGGTLSFDF
jgi:iron complex outermembrane recepter protein